MDHSMDQIQRVLLAQCESIRTPRACTVAILARYGEWTQLQQLRLRPPASYLNSEDYFRDALVTELLRKCDIDTGVDREQAALDAFWASETQCARTNVRLHRFLPAHLLLEDRDSHVADFISQWRKEVSSIVGPLPEHLTPLFSGGATFADVGKLTTLPDKMSSVPTYYTQTADLLPFFWETSWGEVCADRRAPRVVRGNIFFTVPKDSEKFRGCAKEASIPVTLQLCAGSVLRQRLRRIGIDLKSGQDYHRYLARKASVDGSLATLDMSNASDTLSKVLPELLLPEHWFTLLNSLRARFTRVNKRWVRLEKFSSMGNGFTFELETLVFVTLARVLVRLEGGDPDQVSCYGDDLIVPTEHAKSVLAALQYFGFTPNTKKSFLEGPFRESCGGDFFDGKPVRAHYLERLPDEPHTWIALANGLRRVDPFLKYNKSAWMECLKNIPSAIRSCRGPSELGDLVIHDLEAYHTRRTIKSDCGGWENVEYRAYRPVPLVLNWYHWKPEVVLACTTLGVPSSGVTPRKGVSGYKLGWVSDPRDSRWVPRGAASPPSKACFPRLIT